MPRGEEAVLLSEREPLRPSTRFNTLGQEERTRIAERRASDVTAVASVLKGDLDWIVIKCLEKDRGRRYDSSGALAEDIRRFLRREPILARPPSTAYRFSKLLQRHRVAVSFSAALLLILILATAFSLWQAVRATRALARAERESIRGNDMRNFADQLFGLFEPLFLNSRNRIILSNAIARGELRAARSLSNSPAQRVLWNEKLAVLETWVGNRPRAEALLRHGLREAEEHFGAKADDTLLARVLLADFLEYYGRGAEAEPLLESVLADANPDSPLGADALVMALLDLAKIARLRGDTAQAGSLIERTIAAARVSPFGPCLPRVGHLWCKIAAELVSLQQPDRAVNLLRDKIPDLCGEARHSVRNRLAALYFQRGETAKAEQVIDLGLQETNPDNPSFLADLFGRKCDLAISRQLWSRALEAPSEAVKLQPADYGAWNRLATLTLKTGDVQGYGRLCGAGLQLFSNSLSKEEMERTARLLLLRTPDPERMSEAVWLATHCGEHGVTGYLLTQALLKYRQAEWEAAAQEGHGMEPADYPSPLFDLLYRGMARFIAAMAECQLGRSKAARESFEAGDNLCKQWVARREPEGWTDWCQATLLRAEAHDLLVGAGFLSDSAIAGDTADPSSNK